MSKYNTKSIYGTLFTMMGNLSEENQEYLMKKVFDGDFLEDVKDNPEKAYDVLNKIVIDIEGGKKDKVSELLSDYKDKIYMMKNMLKDYGNFKEKIMRMNKKSIKESMTKTQEVFNEAILKSAELVKMINEDGFEQGSKEVEDINDDIAVLEAKLQDLPYDFDEITNLRKYVESVIGKDYFFDKRCWSYLTDIVFEIENNIAWSLSRNWK